MQFPTVIHWVDITVASEQTNLGSGFCDVQSALILLLLYLCNQDGKINLYY